jgi:hypothetical protein
MNYKNKLFFLTSLILFAFLSCEKEIDIALPQHESLLVVEGWIEQGKGAKILLSLSAPYFEPIDSNNIRNYAVTKARVTVKNSSRTEILTLKPNNVFFPPYYYFGSEIFGELNQTYIIEIQVAGKYYTAQTTIPALVKPDSVWFEKTETDDTSGLIRLVLQDNPGTENYYRTLTKRLGKDEKFVPTFTSVFSDKAFNGKRLDISLSRGGSNLLDIENDRYYYVGDTIILKFCSIDKPHYEFWNTIQNQAITSANPFTVSDSKIKSNIENGLGFWGGYAISYDTIVAK